jgi:hypothetical protein
MTSRSQKMKTPEILQSGGQRIPGQVVVVVVHVQQQQHGQGGGGGAPK